LGTIIDREFGEMNNLAASGGESDPEEIQRSGASEEAIGDTRLS
jgi:hypothetical protein